ncbi:hypothetical protein OL548_12140 [Lysinibacillus sp. MHQ-1]|nr:hypothetical protein OL548_12140 [Lysinibacillus sp. MHQ-1]
MMVYVKDLENVEQSIEINWSLIEAYRKAKEQLASKVPLEEKMDDAGAFIVRASTRTAKTTTNT